MNSRSMPTSLSTMYCRPARSCNSPRPRKSYCSGRGGSMSNGTATSAHECSGTTANRSPSTTPAMPFYASEAAPPELDTMLAQLLPKLNFIPPLADLLYRDPYKAVRGNIEYGFDLGQSEFNGRNCRMLAF